jgi:hypothetical protein
MRELSSAGFTGLKKFSQRFQDAESGFADSALRGDRPLWTSRELLWNVHCKAPLAGSALHSTSVL